MNNSLRKSVSNCWISTKVHRERRANLSDAHRVQVRIYCKKRQEPREKEGERFAIAPSHLIGDGSRHEWGPQAGPYKRGLQDIRGASVLKSRNSSNYEGIRGEYSVSTTCFLVSSLRALSSLPSSPPFCFLLLFLILFLLLLLFLSSRFARAPLWIFLPGPLMFLFSFHFGDLTMWDFSEDENVGEKPGERDTKFVARSRGVGGRARAREKVKERGGCTGSIVCGVNVLRDSDQSWEPVQWLCHFSSFRSRDWKRRKKKLYYIAIHAHKSAGGFSSVYVIQRYNGTKLMVKQKKNASYVPRASDNAFLRVAVTSFIFRVHFLIILLR